MGRRTESVAYLDTHIIVWLYAGLKGKLSEAAISAIEENELIISSFSRLELQYLYEIGRITVRPSEIIKNLAKAINVKISENSLTDIIDEAVKLKWTRDVFDRLVVADTAVSKGYLITADKNIRDNFSRGIW